jgi:hypothetical protein
MKQNLIRGLLAGITFLHLGPGIAMALLAFGCDGTSPLLGVHCEAGALKSFLVVTAVAWLLLGSGYGAVHLLRRAQRAEPPALGPRLLALLAVLGVGALLAAAIVWLTGSAQGYLAIPLTLALGWLVLANPANCAAGPSRP